MFALHSGFRALLALLLLVGVMLGGALDAAACEPELHPASLAEVHIADEDQDPVDQERSEGDACVHGHCHHGAQSPVKSQDVTTVMFVAIIPAAVDQTSLVPIQGVTPKRPPRA